MWPPPQPLDGETGYYPDRDSFLYAERRAADLSHRVLNQIYNHDIAKFPLHDSTLLAKPSNTGPNQYRQAYPGEVVASRTPSVPTKRVPNPVSYYSRINILIYSVIVSNF